MSEAEKIARAVGMLDLGKALAINMSKKPTLKEAEIIVMQFTVDAVKDALLPKEKNEYEE